MFKNSILQLHVHYKYTYDEYVRCSRQNKISSSVVHEGYDPERDWTMRGESGTLAAVHVFGVLTSPAHATLNGTAIPFTYDAQHQVRVILICVLTLALVLRLLVLR